MDELKKLLENAGVTGTSPGNQLINEEDTTAAWREITSALVTVIGRELASNPTDDVDTVVQNLLRELYTDVRVKISSLDWDADSDDKLSLVPMDDEEPEVPGGLDFGGEPNNDPWGLGK